MNYDKATKHEVVRECRELALRLSETEEILEGVSEQHDAMNSALIAIQGILDGKKIPATKQG